MSARCCGAPDRAPAQLWHSFALARKALHPSACAVCVLSCANAAPLTTPRRRTVKQWVAQTRAQRAVVVGGGFIGLEMAENLVHLGLQTSVVEMLPQASLA